VLRESSSDESSDHETTKSSTATITTTVTTTTTTTSSSNAVVTAALLNDREPRVSLNSCHNGQTTFNGNIAAALLLLFANDKCYKLRRTHVNHVTNIWKQWNFS